MEERRRLGRGLAALLGDMAEPEIAAAERAGSKRVPIEMVHPNPRNPRRAFDEADLADLAKSIREKGVVQPILVRPWPADYAYTGDMPLYEVVAGERRYRAAKEAGLALIPAMVRALTTREVLKIQTVENLQREDLHPLEEADIKRAKDALKNDPFILHHKEWQATLNQMLQMGVRIEQQAFAKHGLNFVLDTYLPEKLKKGKFLP